MNVTLSDLTRAARARRAPLAAESAGYLILAVADQVSNAPRIVSAHEIELTEEGGVRVLSGRASSEAEAESSLRHALDELLLVASSPSPSLVRAGRRSAPVGLSALVRELEAALIPVNRAAARRTLSRLHRETARAVRSGTLAADPAIPSGVEAALADADGSAKSDPEAPSRPVQAAAAMTDSPAPPSIEEELPLELDISDLGDARLADDGAFDPPLAAVPEVEPASEPATDPAPKVDFEGALAPDIDFEVETSLVDALTVAPCASESEFELAPTVVRNAPVEVTVEAETQAVGGDESFVSLAVSGSALREDASFVADGACMPEEDVSVVADIADGACMPEEDVSVGADIADGAAVIEEEAASVVEAVDEEACTRPEPVVLRKSQRPPACPEAWALAAPPPEATFLDHTPMLGSCVAPLPFVAIEDLVEASPPAPPMVAPRKSDVSELLGNFQVSSDEMHDGLCRAIKEMAELDLTPAPFASLLRGTREAG